MEKAKNGSSAAGYFEWGDNQDPSFKVTAVLLVAAMETPALREQTLERVRRWREECFSPDGIEQISGCGFDGALSAAIDLAGMQTKTHTGSRLTDALRGKPFNNAMLDFFRALSDGEKLLLSAFDSFVTANESQKGQQAVREVVTDFDPDNIPADMLPLLGVYAAAESILSAT